MLDCGAALIIYQGLIYHVGLMSGFIVILCHDCMYIDIFPNMLLLNL
jgi:hypothetical protein